jgi:hypothetical protein
MAVATAISDLFFNHDLSEAKIPDSGKLNEIAFADDRMGYRVSVLTGIAQGMLDLLDSLGVAVPTAEELVADFYARL